MRAAVWLLGGKNVNKRIHYRLALVAAVVLTAAALVPVALVTRQSGAGEEQASDNGFAGDQHRDKLRAALPGNGGESAEGPGSAEAAALAALAYPDTDIPLYRLTEARQAGEQVKSRLPRGGSSGWRSVGPSDAVYPFFGPRDLSTYVPNEYAAGGRVNAMALAPDCVPGNCRLWIGPAGGGVWRTNDALADVPSWRYLSGSFGINSIGAIALDPNDPTSNTIWVGTGEANTCGSGCVHGVGLYKSTDGGNTWSDAIGTSAFGGRGIGSIAVDPRDPSVLYASSTLSLHGMSSVCCSGIQRIVVPGAALWGLYKSTDGGQSWSFIHSGAATTAECGTDISLIAASSTPCTPRGVRVVVLDPTDADTVYAASYGRGVWRSTDGGSTWAQIKASLNSASGITLPWIAVTPLANGDTRMYISEGNNGAPYSRVFRSDRAQAGTPTWTNLTSSDPTDSRWGTYNFCGGQCWYDNFVYTPSGFPDIVYVGGSYAYDEPYANHRAVVLSTDAGASWTDMTADSTDSSHPNALHPDQHFIVTNPTNPFQFIEANDGGVMRSSGEFADVSSWCGDAWRALSANQVRLARCQQMLSRVPTRLSGLNKGLTTLQFQSLSVSPFDSRELQGGTQDNGTWENYGKTTKWLNTIVGDGGQSGFDVGNRHFRFHNFYGASPEVNFSDGAMEDWNWIADPIFFTEPQEFYVPMISDPRVSKTLFVGTAHVWRTKTAGQGTMSLAELRKHCNEWTGDFPTGVTCGDWKPLGGPRLTAASFGTRGGGDVVAVARASSDTSTLWAATSTGRVFVSRNADAEPASSVSFTRIDKLSSDAPNRFISSIYVDPANANHAWISYSGFSSATPSTPGHVFEVTYNPTAGTASWTSVDQGLGDLPITALVRDDVTGSLYAGSDYGVLRLDPGDDSWGPAAEGMPNVEVPGLTIVPGSRLLYAATHGLGAWVLKLDKQ
ncbi:MAG: exo-alpha-sialidase [Candidatus Dormibacteraceae bacterium]